jgi:hypothetical protein
MTLRQKEQIQIPLKQGYSVQSLCWRGEDLVDLVAGATCYRLDGGVINSSFYFAYKFDRAAVSPNGEFAVVYEVLGTKGLVLRNNKVIREINRSYYHAQVYEYPIAMFCLRDGRTVIAHCPDEYNKIEIEEIESGHRLTGRDGEIQDFFHSRMQTSPNGEHLLSAGWVWHPLDAIQLFPVSEVLRNPRILDHYVDLELPKEMFEVHAAAFQDNEFVIMVGDNGGEPGKERQRLTRYEIKRNRLDFEVSLEETAGTIMPVSNEYFVGFHEHPKLFEISSGKVVQRWPEINSGKQNSSILHHLETIPPIALDPMRQRFAVADSSKITVIQLG